MAIALATCTVLDVATMMALRQHYAAPLVASGGNPPGGASAWLLSQWLGGPNGQRFNPANIPLSVQNSSSPDAFTNWLRTVHITQWWSYVPGSDFWRFQLIEGGWLFAVSALLIAAAVWTVRRRAAWPPGTLIFRVRVAAPDPAARLRLWPADPGKSSGIRRFVPRKCRTQPLESN